MSHLESQVVCLYVSGEFGPDGSESLTESAPGSVAVWSLKKSLALNPDSLKARTARREGKGME